MIKSNNIPFDKELQDIVDLLLLHGTLVECPGLLHGKMGIAIFFFHYAHYTRNSLFIDYAWDLIEEIQKQIHANYRADYEKGIAGIGIGIGYLIKNNFLDVEDDIFYDFDERMYRAVMYDPYTDFSLYEGLTGYGKYWIMRLCQDSFSKQAQNCLVKIIKQIEIKLKSISFEEWNDAHAFLKDLQEISDLDVPSELLVQSLQKMQINSNIDLNHKKSPNSMGLLYGYAGEGLKNLTVLRDTDSRWLRLLQSSFTL